MKLYVMHKPYAEKVNSRTAKSEKFMAYYVKNDRLKTGGGCGGKIR